jgi:hypothetical protein
MSTGLRTGLERLVKSGELQLLETSHLSDGTEELVYETQDDIERVSLIRIYQLPSEPEVGAVLRG